jgi:hypothetical protein
MLKRKQAYIELGADYFEQRKINYVMRRIYSQENKKAHEHPKKGGHRLSFVLLKTALV